MRAWLSPLLTSSRSSGLSVFGVAIVLACMGFAPSFSAAQTADATTVAEVPQSKLHYTLGIRMRADDLNQDTRSAKLRPVLGLRYGRWRVGIGDGQEWLRFNSFRKEPTLSYQWIENSDISLGLSMRIHNLNTGEAFDIFEPGRKTLRSRVLANMRITDRWSAGVEWTQDVLNRGDSSTLALGVSYAWPLSQHSELSLNSGITWAPAEHWRTAAHMNRIGAGELTTGIGSVGSGLSYKHSLSKRWAWYSTLGINKAVGQVAKLSGPDSLVNGQIGLLYFDR
ncbi:hypothetical protein B9Z46_09960 [Limnohabitans sp. Hippo4]|nr:hypothetical protein B9Z46_09960 [Limnohabitans sp. Hippo4]